MKLSSWRAWSLLPPCQLLPTSPLSHRQPFSSQRFGETHSKRSKDPSYGLFLLTTSINGTLESSANFLSFCLTLCWILESVSPMAPRDPINRVYLLDEKAGFASENWSTEVWSQTQCLQRQPVEALQILTLGSYWLQTLLFLSLNSIPCPTILPLLFSSDLVIRASWPSEHFSGFWQQDHLLGPEMFFFL